MQDTTTTMQLRRLILFSDTFIGTFALLLPVSRTNPRFIRETPYMRTGPCLLPFDSGLVLDWWRRIRSAVTDEQLQFLPPANEVVGK